MEEKKQTPIEVLAATLAEMTARATEAERMLAEEKERTIYWCQKHCGSESRLAALQVELERETAAHENTKQKLQDLLERMQKETEGAGNYA